MRLDPFRIQFMTVSLDSQIVLTLVGLVMAGTALQRAGRQYRVDLGASDWWDIAFAALVGGRLAWIVTHAEYYLRQPVQALVVLDGGLHAIGLALGTAYWVWRHGRHKEQDWRRVADVVAIGVLTVFLFERVGCALTTCGTGLASELPWAILRGDGWYAPMALEQVVVLAVALLASVECLRRPGAAFSITLGALFLVEVIAFSAGRASLDGVAGLTVLLALYVGAARHLANTLDTREPRSSARS